MTLTNPTPNQPIRTLGDPPTTLTVCLFRDGLGRRQNVHGPLQLLASAEGFVMVRRPGGVPFVLQASDWAALPPAERAA